MKERTLILDTPVIQRLQLKPAIAILASTCLLPFLIHLIPPYQGIPMGAMLLPIFLYSLHRHRIFSPPCRADRGCACPGT